MAEVTYRGGGMEGVTSNAASEATLQRLIQIMEKGNSGGGAATQKMANAVQKEGIALDKKDNTATKDGTEATQDQTKATKSFTQSIKNSAKTIDRYTLGALSGIGNTISTIGGLGTELLTGGNRISDFSAHVTGLISQFPIFGQAIGGLSQHLINIVDNQIDMYRSLSNGGIDFGSSLFESKESRGGRAVYGNTSRHTTRKFINVSSSLWWCNYWC